VLLPDYIFNFEMRLRNVSSVCSCVPTVEVVAARVIFGTAHRR
jgi:hypothetical protein